MKHLKVVLTLLSQHHLYVKASKCIFGCQKVKYLGYIISKEGIKANPKKIAAMMNWQLTGTPRNPKALRDFLGLTGYYRKFVERYGKIATTLTALLRKNSFRLSEEETEAFSVSKLPW